MQETTLYKLSIVSGSIGVVVLLFMSLFLELPVTSIDSLTDDVLDRNVRIIGKVREMEDFGNRVQLVIEHPSKLDVMLFADGGRFSVGDTVEVLGTLEEYKESYQLVGESVHVLDD
tara:strand:- start:3583 stop:3930 length:348 start_codon:yes stop_codon:yes gene_type:complete